MRQGGARRAEQGRASESLDDQGKNVAAARFPGREQRLLDDARIFVAQQPRELRPGRPEERVEVVRVVFPDEAPQRLGQRCVGETSGRDGQAAPDQGGRRQRVKAGEELGDQAALADPRIPGNEDDPWSPVARVAEGVGSVVVALTGLLLMVLFARFLYQRRIFLRV